MKVVSLNPVHYGANAKDNPPKPRESRTILRINHDLGRTRKGCVCDSAAPAHPKTESQVHDQDGPKVEGFTKLTESSTTLVRLTTTSVGLDKGVRCIDCGSWPTTLPTRSEGEERKEPAVKRLASHSEKELQDERDMPAQGHTLGEGPVVANDDGEAM